MYLITKKSIKNGAFALLAATTVLGLSGCITLPEVGHGCSGTPPFNPNAPLPRNCMSSVIQTLDSPIFASELANTFDASKFKADMMGSTVGIPQTGLYSITLSNQSGQPISQNSFSWTRQGNIISIDNPIAVQNWMASVPGTVKSVKTNFVSLPVQSSPGINAYMITIKYDQVILGSAGSVWTESSCNNGPLPGTSNCLSEF